MGWQPLHENHSIENTSAAINFAEPLTEIIWRKTLREAEAKAQAAGLTERNSIGSVQIAFGPQGVIQPNAAVFGQMAPSPIESIRFMRSQIIEGTNQKIAAEAISIGKGSFVYQTTTYTRWNAFFERLEALLVRPLSISLDAVRPANLRLEYKDTFRFEGGSDPFPKEFLRENSPLITPHIFDRRDLWHSHTGFFEQTDNSDQRLVQINIDANDVFEADGSSPSRTVGIMTAVQENFHRWPEDPEQAPTPAQLVQKFESMHRRSVAVFGEIINDETAKRIGLT